MGVFADLFDELVSDQVADARDAKSGQSSTSREFEAAVRDQLSSGAQALSSFTGSKGLKDFADDQEKTANLRRSRSTYVQSWDDVDGIGDLASYTAKLGINTAPAIAGMVASGGAAGVAAKAAGYGLRGIRAAQAGGALASQELQTIGDVQKAQIDQAGEVDIPSSVALGTASNLLNLAGVEGAAIRGLPKSLLASRKGRALETGVRTAATESAAEVGQQFAEEAGRRVVDENFDVLGDDARKRYKESAIGGALLGGVIGGSGGALSRGPASDNVTDRDEPTINEPLQTKIAGYLPPPAIRAKDESQQTVPDKPKIDDDFFTGATIETLRPTNGGTSIAEAIRNGGTFDKFTRDLANSVTSALSKRDVDGARNAVMARAERITAPDSKLTDEQRETQGRSIYQAAYIVDAFERNVARLKSGQVEADVAADTQPIQSKQLKQMAREAKAKAVGQFPVNNLLPAPNAQQSIETAGTPASDPRGTETSPDSGNQTEIRNKLLQQAIRANPKRPESEFKRLLALTYPDKKMQEFMGGEREQLVAHAERVAANSDLQAGIEASQIFDNASKEAATPIEAPVDPDEDTTLGVPEAKPAPKGPSKSALAYENRVNVNKAPKDPEPELPLPGPKPGRKTALQQMNATSRQIVNDTVAGNMVEIEEARAEKEAAEAVAFAAKQDNLFDAEGNPSETLRTATRLRAAARPGAAYKAVVGEADKLWKRAKDPVSKRKLDGVYTAIGMSQLPAAKRMLKDTADFISNQEATERAKLTPIAAVAPEVAPAAAPVRFLDDEGIRSRILRLVDEGVMNDDDGRAMIARSRKDDASAVKVEKEIFALEGKGTSYMPDIKGRPTADEIDAAIDVAQPRVREARGRAILRHLRDRAKMYPGFSTKVLKNIIDNVVAGDFAKANLLFDNEAAQARGRNEKATKDVVKTPDEIAIAEAYTRLGRYTVENFEMLSERASDQIVNALEVGDHVTANRIIDEDIARIDRALAKAGTPRGTNKSIGLNVRPAEGKAPYMPARDGELYFAESGAVTKAEGQKIVDDIKKKWPNLPKVLVMQASQPASKFEYDRVEGLLGPNFRGQFGFDGQTPVIIINVDAHTTFDDVEATIYHEALGHFGLRAAYGAGFGRLLRNIYDSDRAYYEPRIRERVAAFGGADAQVTPFDINYHMEEMLAEKSEAGLMREPGVLQRVMDFIRGFARRMGWNKGAFSESELQAIVRAGQKAATTGPKPRTRTLIEASRVPGYRTGATSNVSPTDKRTPDQRVRDTLTNLGAPDHVISTAITARTLARKHFQGMLFGKDLADYIAPLLKNYSPYQQLMQQKQQISNEYNRKIDQLLTDANRQSKPELAAMTEFMTQATMSNKWGYQPKWITERKMVGGKWTVVPKTVAIDPEQAKAYKALPFKSRELVDAFFKMGFESREELRDLVRAQQQVEADEALALARNETERRDVERQRKRAANLFDNRVPSLAGPYVPLSRFGSYITVGRSKALAELEAIESPTATQEVEISEMKADPKHYYVSMHDTAGQAEADKQLLMKRFPDWVEPYSGAKEEFYGSRPEAGWMAMQRLKETVKDQLNINPAFDARTVHSINMMLRDLYYSSLAEDSARKHDLRREGVPGVKHAELLQAISTKGRADSHFIAALTHSDQMTKQLQKMREEANADDNLKSDRKLALNEVIARHTRGMEYDSTPFQDKLTSMSAFYYLLTLPRYYIQNALQTGMVTAPVLAGRFGATKAWSAVFDAYKVFKPIMANKDSIAAFAAGKFDVKELGLAKDETEFLQHMRSIGLLDIGMNYDMGYWESGDNRISQNMSQMTHWFRTKSQQIEVLNRVSAGIASFRLSRGEGKSMEDATKFASSMIYQTHGDYSMSNAPRYMNMLPKFVTQFRKYQLIQVSLLARNVYNSFGRIDSSLVGQAREDAIAEQLVARKTLAHLLGQTAVVTGAFGLPMVQGLSYAMSMAFGDEDEPADGERFVRQWIGNDDLADLLLKGVPAAAGVDVSGNLGMGTALSLLPFTEFDNTREGYDKVITDLLGPGVGMGRNIWDGLGQVRSGDTQKGVEQMLPSGFRELLRTYRTVTDGYTKRNGDLLLAPDEFSWGETFAMGMGFKPTQMVERGRKQGDLIEYDEYFKGRVGQIKKAYARADRDNDLQTKLELRKAWDGVQDAKRRTGFKPNSLSDLLNARREQAKRERNTVGGVQTTNANRKFVEGMTGE